MIEFHELTLETYTATLILPCPLGYICVSHTAFSFTFLPFFPLLLYGKHNVGIKKSTQVSVVYVIQKVHEFPPVFFFFFFFERMIISGFE